jgi:hypothetical protein
LPPATRARIRQIAEEPLISWYLASDSSLSRQVAKEKYDHMGDQEVFNLFLKIKPILDNVTHDFTAKPEALGVSQEPSLSLTPTKLDPPARSQTPKDAVLPSTQIQKSASPEQHQPTHTPTHVAPSSAEPSIALKTTQKIVLPELTVIDTPPGPPVLLCARPGLSVLTNARVEFIISAEQMVLFERWKARYLTPAGYGPIIPHIAQPLIRFLSDSFSAHMASLWL